MKVLVLSPYPQGLLSALEIFADEYEVTSNSISREYCLNERFEFLVSYGYRHIIRQDVLDLFPGKAINLHISLLPFCRGAHPILWSILEGKPLGVTIHMLDAGIDTGSILFQQVTPRYLEDTETFASLYKKHCESIEFLFRHNWKYLRTAECFGWEQQGSPTIHRSSELDDLLAFMPQQWDTTIIEFCRLAGISHPLLPIS